MNNLAINQANELKKAAILAKPSWQEGPFVTHSYLQKPKIPTPLIREDHKTLAEAVQAAEVGWLVDVFIKNDLKMIWRDGQLIWENSN